MQKILVISHEYPPIGGGGGKVIQDLCEGIASDEYAFYVLTSHYQHLPEFEIRENITIERINVGRNETFRASLSSMFRFVWKSFWRALKLIRIWEPNLIHAHFAVPGGASAAFASKWTGKPMVLTIHGGDVPGGAPEKTDRWFRFIKPFTGYIWKNAAKIIAVSDYSRQLALSHYPVEIAVIPNGIDRNQFRTENSIVHSPPQILFVGRFSPEKNAVAVPVIMQAVSTANWHCTMIGDGPQLEKVQKDINQFGLEDQFTLTGWLELEDVYQHFQKADILLMPSLRESMPMAGLQALAAGNALVLSRVGACPEMVDDGENGFLVAPGDVDGYARVIESLLATKDFLAKAKNHSKMKSAAFDIQSVLDQYKRIYEEVGGA